MNSSSILATRKADQNRAALDPWTAVHLAAGLALGLLNVPLRWAAAGGIAYEVAEQFLERREFGKELFDTSGPESLANAVMDSVFLVAGHKLGTLWNRTPRRAAS